MNKPHGQGRKPGLNQARAMQQRASENMLALLVKDTGRARPEWFLDRSLLPKRPPGASHDKEKA